MNGIILPIFFSNINDIKIIYIYLKTIHIRDYGL